MYMYMEGDLDFEVWVFQNQPAVPIHLGNGYIRNIPP